jgi:hypothetical protein
MNEILNQLIIRILFVIFIVVLLVIYKYIHIWAYPSKNKQFTKIIYPAENAADSLHAFGRIIGIALVFSNISAFDGHNVFYSSINFFFKSFICFAFYIGSLFITEGIVFYNFTYEDEILKKKNMAYALISFSNCIALAFIIRTVFFESQHSFILLFILWLFSICIYGFVLRSFRWISQMSFKKMLIHKNISLAISFLGYSIAATILILSALSQKHDVFEFFDYLIQIIMKMILGVLIFPLIKKMMIIIFRISDELETNEQMSEIGFGVFEGTIFLAAALLTTMVTAQINFGTIYPVF